eukprot:CAMPEP_0181231690 /NCGR_PEP_ID=MMETSP1096-20121128/35264_1 /TAXON_ID=156174 ORGANISM="Chrysochromulina ericina, Strain CCMP281" /NCGR_SAMPLE_ID=MMETSP1096 /ASSEMBLY_ACC=CAM_ASM_000453 /LENGTH=72 /DNA_ID=CAMNT_0023325795 /DNA_START=335 /DNA_END=551 /DNA_ORIENTATION=-
MTCGLSRAWDSQPRLYAEGRSRGGVERGRLAGRDRTLYHPPPPAQASLGRSVGGVAGRRDWMGVGGLGGSAR